MPEVKYRGYLIWHYSPPIPVRDFDWHYAHKDHDGAPDSGDTRCGSVATIDEAKREIDDLIAEEDPDA